MINSNHILISLDACHAKKIYAGTKKVELRRRTMHIKPETIIWIYEKLPIGAITGFATVKTVNSGTPKQLWEEFGSVAGINESEFFGYFSNTEKGCALELSDINQIDQSVKLNQLRELKKAFQPPQFFIRIPENHPLFEELNGKHQFHKNSMDLHPVRRVA